MKYSNAYEAASGIYSHLQDSGLDKKLWEEALAVSLISHSANISKMGYVGVNLVRLLRKLTEMAETLAMVDTACINPAVMADLERREPTTALIAKQLQASGAKLGSSAQDVAEMVEALVKKGS